MGVILNKYRTAAAPMNNVLAILSFFLNRKISPPKTENDTKISGSSITFKISYMAARSLLGWLNTVQQSNKKIKYAPGLELILYRIDLLLSKKDKRLANMKPSKLEKLIEESNTEGKDAFSHLYELSCVKK